MVVELVKERIMKQKKYKYKHLTDEMKKLIDEEIKKIGRSKLYEKVEHNIETQHISHLQNENGAFKEIRKSPWVTTQWEYKYFTEPNVIDKNNLDLEHEILHYIDSKKLVCGV